jgi:lipopolysaccharide/colanic/teichoic acid biosynthesis glycosyltransferase
MVFDRRETAILVLGDFCLLVASLWAALALRALALPSLARFEANVIPFLPVFLLSLGVFYVAGLYEKPTRLVRHVMGARIIGAQAATVALAAVLFFVLPLSIAPKTILVLYFAVSVAAESLWRFSRTNRDLPEAARESAVLVGRGTAVRELFHEIHGNGRYRIRFTRRIDTAAAAPGTVAHAVAHDLEKGARLVVVDAADDAVVRDAPALYEYMAAGIPFLSFATLYEDIFDRVPLDYLTPDRLVAILPERRGAYDLAKRLFDLFGAVVVGAVALPFVAVAALALSLEGGAPFIRHERIGKGGHIFRIVKLRTMLLNDHGDPELRKKNRVTTLGKVLRKTRIDELPQIWNVLQGDLSFIGPRPELPSLARVYDEEIPAYQLRHLIVPGLSGWAQIHDYDAPRGGADVARTRRKLSFDLYYLKHRSFGLDAAIVFKTLRALSALSGT